MWIVSWIFIVLGLHLRKVALKVADLPVDFIQEFLFVLLSYLRSI